MKTKTPKTTRQRHEGGLSEALTILRVDRDGEGIARTEEGDTRVWGAFPGELVRISRTPGGKVHRFRVLRSSPDRITSPCQGSGCDGCPFIAWRYEAQLRWKTEMVTAELRKYPSLANVAVEPTIPSPKPLGYRTTAKLVVSGKHADPQIGVYRRNSHEVVDIGHCPLHHPLINKIAAATREGIRKGKVEVYNPRNGRGLLRYLIVRVSEATGRAMVVFGTLHRSFNEIHHLAKYVRSQVPEVEVVDQNVNPSTGNVILGRSDHFETRAKTLEETILGLRLELSPRSFLQVNPGGAAAIYGTVVDWSGIVPGVRVLDLYCGIGAISLLLAHAGGKVTGVEVVDQAVLDAEKNARINRIAGASFEAGDAAEVLEELAEDRERFDLIVLNPPRKGCDRDVLEKAAALDPRRMIYVSCSPATLSRDLHILSSLGYVTRRVQPVDMFPQTPHVENVALIERTGKTASPPPRPAGRKTPPRKR